jgi:hypothetical protein
VAATRRNSVKRIGGGIHHEQPNSSTQRHYSREDDGQKVRVTVQVIDENHVPGEGLRRAFGAWADDSEGLDEYLEWNRQQRKINRPEIDP